MNWSRVIVVLGAALLAAGTAGAQAPQGGSTGSQGAAQDGERPRPQGPGRGGAMGRMLFNGIELTVAQQAQMDTIREKYRGQMQELRGGAGGGSGSLRNGDPTIRDKIRAIQEKQQAEIRTVLTAEQQAVFDRNIAEIRARRAPGG